MKTLPIQTIPDLRLVNRLLNERFLPQLPEGYIDWIANDAFQKELDSLPRIFKASSSKEYSLVWNKGQPEALFAVTGVSPPMVSFARISRVILGSGGFQKQAGTAEGYEYVDAVCRKLIWAGHRGVSSNAVSPGGRKAFVDLAAKCGDFYNVHFKREFPETVFVHLNASRCEICAD